MMEAAGQMIDAAKQSESRFDCLDGEIYEIDKFEDEDVDELLGWTNALNFDELVLFDFHELIFKCFLEPLLPRRLTHC